MAVLRSLEGLDPPHLRSLHSQRPCRSGARLFVLIVPGALPGHQDAALPEERRRVLQQHREWGHRAGGDGVVGLAAALGGPGLRSLRDCRGVRDLRSGREATDDLALAAGRLDQVDLAAGQRDGQGEAREPRPRPDVADATAPSQLRGLQADEAVG
jgi:hypothetical protein